MKVPYVDIAAENRAIAGELADALSRVVDHGQLILGAEVAELERRLADYLGVAGVVSLNSGTDALVMALKLRGVGPGDEVITPSHSFLASANAVALAGARPIFVDIDEETMCIDPLAAAAAITPATRAILVVHLNGFPVDLAPFEALAAKHGVALIEDAAQALGARRRGRFAGAAGLGCFSLHPLKVLGALGDAGFIAVQSSDDAAAARLLRNHGLVDRDRASVVGGNTRLDALQAAFLLVKLDHLDRWIAARRAHGAAYREALAGRVRLPPDPGDGECNGGVFVVRHPRRDRLRDELAARGIDAKVHYPLAIHQQPTFRDGAPRLPVTEKVVGEILSLPVSPQLADRQRQLVIDAVREVAAL